MKITFCGHREILNREQVEQWLRQVCSNLIQQGADEFFIGGYGSFDSMCASVLREMKKAHSHIRLVLVLPYLNSSVLTEGYDETVYPPLESVPKRYAVVRRNEWMVRECDVVIAYVIRGFGGAAQTLEYAQRKKKTIIRYAESAGES